MRIMHVVVSLDPALGGPPAVASRLAAAQTDMSGAHQVVLASHGSPGRQAEVDASLRGIPNMEKVKIIALPPHLQLRAIVPPETKRQFREAMTHVDIVHLHGVWEPLVRAASVEARKLGVPYVMTTHGMLDPWCLKQRWLKKKIALLLAYRSMLNSAAGLHLLNHDEAELIKPLRLLPPTRVIPNGVFLHEIEPLPKTGAFHARHPELRGQPFVLFLGRLHFKKGLDYLAEAFAIVAKQQPSLRLVVAGPEEGARADFEERIAKAGLTNRVHLVGPLWGPEKFAAMVDAACFCLPSRQEGFSMAITEAMACGTPVVISDACHFPEVAAAGAGEVVPLQGAAVAAALLRVLGDPNSKQGMGKAGRELVLTRFTWPTIAQEAVSMYETAIAARKK